MKTIRWGIIGVGDVTEVKSGPAFQKANSSALVAVMRRNAALAEDYAKRHNVPKWYADADSLINDPDVDAVYIATPPDAHQDYTLRCAAAGKPVYVEKPMARNTAECETMIEACQTTSVPLYVAYYRRALPRFLKIKELIAAGAIGDVRSVTISLYQQPQAELYTDKNNLPWRVLPERSGGGHFIDLAAHMLDFLDFALGPISDVTGFASNHAHLYPAEDIVSGSFLFESGVHGMGTWCFTAYEHLDQTEIVGTKGKISYATFGITPVKLATPDGVTEFDIANPPHIQQPFIQSIVDDLNGIGTCPSTGVTAARTTRVMDAILQGYYER